MPRPPVVTSEIAEYSIEGPKMAPPAYLTPEQAGFWHGIVDAFPAGRFGPDHLPVLVELTRHMALSAQLNEQLAELRRRDLNRASKKIDDHRSIFLQLSTAAREESKLIAALSVKLRLVADFTYTARKADADRREETVGQLVPWAEAEVVLPHVPAN